MQRFDNKVVLVTGGGSGIGAAAAKRFSAEGARVVIAGRNADKLHKLVAELPADRTLAVTADVSDSGECARLVAATVERFGRLDTLVNNAGANIVGSVAETDDETWRACIGADLDSVFYMIRAALPHLEKTRGSVVNVGSVSSLGGGWSHAAYCAAKAAVANLTRSVACDAGKAGVRANTVCPGLTVTDMVSEIMKDDALLEKAWERIPLRRAGEPSEVAAAIAFLASDEAKFITGAALPVDGGQTATDGGPEWGK
ncbi:SDR family NAD(P)-dependent oxidoreductase [Pseudoduganella albidiflava]|uniref:SDR family oxidoreductase n=1 Tax=Pseudoduganella albidiflava TaxID=321983 RepID=A0A411WVQ2_9BURK|nr:SDR family oxidoreductase [Pseudoduganella albidiflava]QBI00824.1 SDR family oxidoreductase [Pseudoduganella albidiflava]GGY30466.1 short-chain dehydrogenase [Pseudoduganella albidiflava]